MKKSIHFFGLLSAVFVLFSCVPPDPAAVYGPNWNQNPNSPSSGITGPRILHKIDSANVTITEYVSTNAGKLEKVLNHNQNNQFLSSMAATTKFLR